MTWELGESVPFLLNKGGTELPTAVWRAEGEGGRGSALCTARAEHGWDLAQELPRRARERAAGPWWGLGDELGVTLSGQ